MGNLRELRENAATSVAEDLKKGTALWHKQELPSSMPKSLVSGREFGGINALYLIAAAAESGFGSPYWMPRPGEQKNVEQDKKIFVKKGEKGTAVEFWAKSKDDENKLEPRTATYFNVAQINPKSLESFGNSTEAAKNAPNYDAADVVLSGLGVKAPKERNPKEYHAALAAAVGEIAKGTPKMEQIPTADLKKLRTDMGTSFLSLSLGMGVPEADKSLPTRSWADSIGRDPRQLAYAARDAQGLAAGALALSKGLNAERAKEKEAEKLSPENLKVGDIVVCRKDSRDFIGEVKSAEADKVVVAAVLRNGETKEYQNLHERGWKYESPSPERGKTHPGRFPRLEKGQEVVLTPKIVDPNGKNKMQLVGTITKAGNEKTIDITTVQGQVYTFNKSVLGEKWNVEKIPYGQTLKCAQDKVEKLREDKVLSFASKTPVVILPNSGNLKSENTRLLDETDKYAIIGAGKDAKTPLVVPISFLGEDNMKKLRETQKNDKTVLLEKWNTNIKVKTVNEAAQERAQAQAQSR